MAPIFGPAEDAYRPSVAACQKGKRSFNEAQWAGYYILNLIDLVGTRGF